MMDSIDQINLIAVFLDIVIKSFLLLGITWALLRLIPSSASRTRYRLLVLSFCILAALPLLSFIPRTNIGFFNSQLNIEKQLSPPYLKKLEPYPQKANDLIAELAQRPILQPVSSATSIQAIWPLAMMFCWLIVCLSLVLYNTLGLIRWKRSCAGYQRPVPDKWQTIKNKVASVLSMTQYPDIIFSEKICSPLTYGWRNPMVVFPAAAASWPVDRIQLILLHEGIHIKRGDYFFSNMVQMTLAVFWFNPIAWIFARQLKLECERSCDEAVVQSGVSRITYAKELLAIASQPFSNTFTQAGPAGLAVAQKSLLHKRFQTLLAPPAKPFRLGILLKTGVIGLAALFTFFQFQTPLPYLFSTEQSLISQIKKGNSQHTQQILLALVNRDVRVAGNDILPLLSDENPQIRALSAWALGKLKSKKAIGQLTGSISDQNDDVKEYVLLSLAEFGYSNTFYDIVPLLKHPKAKIRKAALWALSQIGCLPAFYHTSRHLEDTDPSVRKLAALLIDSWNREKLYHWMSNYLQFSNTPSLCTDSLEGVLQLDQADNLVKCLAPENTDLQQELSLILNHQDREIQLKQLKLIFSKL